MLKVVLRAFFSHKCDLNSSTDEAGRLIRPHNLQRLGDAGFGEPVQSTWDSRSILDASRRLNAGGRFCRCDVDYSGRRELGERRRRWVDSAE